MRFPSPLHTLKELVNRDILEWLSACGGSTHAVDENGVNPLMYAMREGHIASISFLLSHGVDINSLISPPFELVPLTSSLFSDDLSSNGKDVSMPDYKVLSHLCDEVNESVFKGRRSGGMHYGSVGFLLQLHFATCTKYQTDSKSSDL